MNKLIEQTGTPRSLVYVGEECLLCFPTNQQAWEYLSELSIIADKEEEAWPEEVYVVFMIEDFGNTVSVPQIDKVVKEGEKLRYKGLFGDDFTDFRQMIIRDWPTIKEGLRNA